MKKVLLTIFPIAVLFLQSCNQNNSPAAVQDPVLNTAYYLAADGQDTAHLTLDTYAKSIKGKLRINFHKKEMNAGEIKGSFKGDTLFADYTFQVGDKELKYKNPLAFLKKDGKLILGIGKMKTTIGRTYFSKEVPIDFSKGRFIFSPQYTGQEGHSHKPAYSSLVH